MAQTKVGICFKLSNFLLTFYYHSAALAVNRSYKSGDMPFRKFFSILTYFGHRAPYCCIKADYYLCNIISIIRHDNSDNKTLTPHTSNNLYLIATTISYCKKQGSQLLANYPATPLQHATTSPCRRSGTRRATRTLRPSRDAPRL